MEETPHGGKTVSKHLANMVTSVLTARREGEWCSDGRADVPWPGVRGASQRRWHLG